MFTCKLVWFTAYRLIDKFQLKKINNIDCFDFDPKSKSVAKNFEKNRRR